MVLCLCELNVIEVCHYSGIVTVIVGMGRCGSNVGMSIGWLHPCLALQESGYLSYCPSLQGSLIGVLACFLQWKLPGLPHSYLKFVQS